MITVDVPGPHSVFLRPADVTDTLISLQWINDPDHDSFVILIDHEAAGRVLFSISGTEATISLYLLKPFTEKGLGPAIIAQACHDLFRRRPNIDQILAADPASLTEFQKSGFEKFSNNEETISLKLNRPTPSRVIPHNRPTWDEAEITAAADAAASGRWVNGPWTHALENRLSQISTGSWTATSSGFAALKLSLHALGICAGDEVLVPAYSCVALPNAALALGATPIPVNIDDSLNISPKAALAACTDKSKAIIAVNTFGLQADISGLKQTHLPVVEDGSHGFPVTAGKWNIQGDLALLSFYATKLFGCGQGGAVMARTKDQLDTIHDLASYSDKAPSAHRDNLGLSEMEAAIAYRQLDKQEQILSHRQKIAEIYRQHFNHISTTPNSISYRFVISLPDEATLLALQSHLLEKEITTERPVELWNTNRTAQKAYQTTLSLPLFPTLSKEDAHRVSDTISSFLNHV